MAKLNLDRARVARSRGWSYERIARAQDVSTSTVYYALNKHRRSQGRRGRTIYPTEETWAVVQREARARGVSSSELVVGILEQRFGGG